MSLTESNVKAPSARHWLYGVTTHIPHIRSPACYQLLVVVCGGVHCRHPTATPERHLCRQPSHIFTSFDGSPPPFSVVLGVDYKATAMLTTMPRPGLITAGPARAQSPGGSHSPSQPIRGWYPRWRAFPTIESI